MSILTREGIKALSQLEIDVTKDWKVFGIHNIKEVVAGMSTGDIIARGSEVLVKISPGLAGYVLTSSGPGKLPFWAPPPDASTWYFSAWIELSKDVRNFTPEKILSLLAPLATDYPIQETPDKTAIVTSSTDAAVITPTEISKATGSPYNNIPYILYLLDGAIAYYGPTPPGPVEYDQLTASRDDTPNDMNLPPQNDTIPPNECYYFGCLHKFDYLWIDVTRAGVGNFALDIRYWNGSSWEIPPDLVDNLNDFQSVGLVEVHFTIPGDWALSSIGGYNLYWVRIACVSMVNLITSPLGGKAWVQITYPFP